MFILWSGGKDSYLSYKKAVSRGLRPTVALSYVELRSRRLIGCHLRESLIREQVSLLGLRFVPVYGSKRRGNFREKLIEVLREIRPQAGVFGDIYQKEHRLFLEGACSELGIRAVFPLWYMDEDVLIEEALRLSTPLIVCRRVRKLPSSWLGKELGEELLEYLRSKGLSVSGEDGEYQTFVARCEEFSMKLRYGRRFRKSYYECIDLEVEER